MGNNQSKEEKLGNVLTFLESKSTIPSVKSLDIKSCSPLFRDETMKKMFDDILSTMGKNATDQTKRNLVDEFIQYAEYYENMGGFRNMTDPELDILFQ